MDQEKIGSFIATCRKNKKLTQSELANKLGISDRAISNWENGKNMPDLSLFKPLCEILSISVNDLLNGEIIDSDNPIEVIEYANVEIEKIKKKNKKKIIIIIIGLIITLGIIFGISDYNKIIVGENPNFMVRITSGGESTHYYIGLGYMMERKVGVSYKEPIKSSLYVRFGFWLFTWNVDIIDISPEQLILRTSSNEITANMGSYCWTNYSGRKAINECLDTIGPVGMEYNEFLSVEKEEKIIYKLNDCNITNIELYKVPEDNINWYDIVDSDYKVNYNVSHDNSYIIAPSLEGSYIMVVHFTSEKGDVWYSFKLDIE